MVIEDYHRRLSQRVNQLMAKAELQVNQADLIKEVAVFAERADICRGNPAADRRIWMHSSSRAVTGEHAGRKLDFIAQEMLREANTIAQQSQRC